MFVNCCGDSEPVEGTIVDVRDIVTHMMHYDVMLHLVSVYIGLSCATLSVVLVFKQSNLILESFHGAAGELCISKVPVVPIRCKQPLYII